MNETAPDSEATPMQIQCPNCGLTQTAPDQLAGKSYRCTSCSHEFILPMLASAPPLEATVIGNAPGLPPMSPPVAPPIPIVPPTPPVPPPPAAVPEVAIVRVEPTSEPIPPGYETFRMVKLPVKVVEWLPAVALGLAVLLTFARWNGVYPAGYGSYTQNGWQATFGLISRNPVSEKELKLYNPLNERVGGNWMLLPALLLLLGAATVAIGSEVLARRDTLPAALGGVWPHRLTILTVLLGTSLLLLLVQLQLGLGLEKALTGLVKEQHQAELAAAETDEEIQRVEIRIAKDMGGYHLRRTVWLSAIVLCEWLALAAVGAQLLLRRRGTKPPPGAALLW